jgi:ribosomal protein S18 acetylase RimI-like enzyme
LGSAAHILTEAFYSHRTNFITFQIEKLKTALSLESTFDKQRTNPMGQMFVACSSQTGKVVGFAEVDTCSLKANCDEVKECGIDEAKSNLPRPYMYNLAVDNKWKRRGVATALVAACEKFVANIDWSLQNNDESILKYKQLGYTDAALISQCQEFVDNLDEEERWIYLRVRKNNDEAIAFYTRLGYAEIDPSSIALTKSDVNSNSAEEGELILMGKILDE